MTDIQFPNIPDDENSKYLLSNLTRIGLGIIRSNPSHRQRKFGATLVFLGTAPHDNPYLYFQVYTKLKPRIEFLTGWYNSAIFKKGQEFMVKTINSQIGDLMEYFDDFQFSFFPIQKRAKTDPDWNPLNGLLWGLYCSLYDRNKSDQFLDAFKKALESSNPHPPGTEPPADGGLGGDFPFSSN